MNINDIIKIGNLSPFFNNISKMVEEVALFKHKKECLEKKIGKENAKEFIKESLSEAYKTGRKNSDFVIEKINKELEK